MCNVKKSIVNTVGLPIPNDMERPEKTNKDFVAIIATKLLFKSKIRLQKTSWANPNAQNSLLKTVLLSQK